MRVRVGGDHHFATCPSKSKAAKTTKIINQITHSKRIRVSFPGLGEMSAEVLAGGLCNIASINQLPKSVIFLGV